MRSAAAVTAAAMATLSTLAAADGIDFAPRVGLSNKCDFNVYVWYVGGSVKGPETNPAEVGYLFEDIQKDPVSGGRAIKFFTEENGLYNGSPHLNLAYNFEDPLVWYELSDVFGSAFEGTKVNVTSKDQGCEEFIWEDGVQPVESNLQVCETDVGFDLTLC